MNGVARKLRESFAKSWHHSFIGCCFDVRVNSNGDLRIAIHLDPSLPLLALPARCDATVERVNVWLQTEMRQIILYFQGPFPLPALLASAYDRVEDNEVGLQSPVMHFIQNRQRSLPLRALLTRRDGGARCVAG